MTLVFQINEILEWLLKLKILDNICIKVVKIAC